MKLPQIMNKSANTLVFYRLFSYTISIVSLDEAILSLSISMHERDMSMVNLIELISEFVKTFVISMGLYSDCRLDFILYLDESLIVTNSMTLFCTTITLLKVCDYYLLNFQNDRCP